MSLLDKKEKRQKSKKYTLQFGGNMADQMTSPKSGLDSSQDGTQTLDLIFGDFKKKYKQQVSLQDRWKRFGAKHKSIDGIQSQALTITDRNQIEVENINTKVLNRKDTSIQ